jgi:hypothetical protein
MLETRDADWRPKIEHGLTQYLEGKQGANGPYRSAWEEKAILFIKAAPI